MGVNRCGHVVELGAGWKQKEQGSRSEPQVNGIEDVCWGSETSVGCQKCVQGPRNG